MRKLLLAAAFLMGLVRGAAALEPAASPWPQAFANPQHTSSTTATGPLRPRVRWTAYPSGPNSQYAASAITLGADGKIFALTRSSAIAYSPSGSEAWRALLTQGSDNHNYDLQAAISSSGVVYTSTINAASSVFSAIGLSTGTGATLYAGTQLCVAGTAYPGGSPTLAYGTTAFYPTTNQSGSSGGTYCATGVGETGNIAWQNIGYASYPGDTGPVAVSTDGAQMYFTTSGDLYALRTSNGGLLFSKSGFSHASVSVGGNGNIYAIASPGLRAYDPTGTLLWTYTLSNIVPSPPTVSGTRIFISTGDAMSSAAFSVVAIDDLGASASLAWRSDAMTTTLTQTRNCGGASCTSLIALSPPVVGGNLVYYTMKVAMSGNTSPAERFIVALNQVDGSSVSLVALPPPPTASGGSGGMSRLVPDTSQAYFYAVNELLAFEDSTAASFSVTASSQTLAPGEVSTFTAVVLNGASGPVSGVGVVFEIISSTRATPLAGIAFTNALGIATMTFSSSSLNSSVLSSTFVVRTHCMNFPQVDIPVYLEGEAISHFDVQVPTVTPIGVPFEMKVFARNAYGHALPSFPGTSGPVTVNLSPFLAGTQVAGSGSFGVTSVGISNGTGTVSSQTYNKIESIQAKAAQTSPGVAVGLSTAMVVTGPDNFIITMPTGTTAGQSFPVTITAVNGSTQVAGYSATLALSAVVWNSTATNATGSLGVTSVNMPPTGQVTINSESFDRGAGIRIRAYDSALGVQGYSSSMTVVQPALTISHYSITAPTQVTVGLPFSFQVNALDASSAPVTYTLSRNITVQTFLNGTAIAGSGSLGLAAMTLQAGSTYTYTASQTYNKIETIQIKVTDEDGRNVTSGPILFSGPTQFDVTMPTAALAGTPFQIVVVARDSGNNQVLGYSGTVNIAAVQASNTALSGAGTLGVTSLNVAAGLGTSSFQTYTKAEGIRLRVSDSAIAVTSYSSSATVRAGTPASITLLANPQSTIAGVPSVLTATVYDAYTNPVTNSTATFSVAVGSGVVSLSLSNGSIVSAVTSTQAVTDAFGQATAFFSSTNSLSAQSNLLRASLGSLARDTTVYSTVLITSAGGAVVNFSNPLLRADIPANTYGFAVRLGIAGRDELPAADLALTTAAFAATANTFVSTTVLKLSAVRDASPTTAAGAGSKLVTVSMPYTVTSGSISVGAYGAQSILVPLSVMRIFKLNQASSVFEQVIDGVTTVNSVTGVVSAEVSDPDGIYALGAPSFTNLATGSSATVTTALAGGTTAEVVVPPGGFAAPATISVTVPGASAVPALPVRPGLTALGVTISVNAGGLQPATPVTIKIGYTLANIAGVNPDHLRLARYDATTGWVVLDSSADTATRQVIGTTDHFSLFQIVAQAPGASVADGFVFPNPYRPSAGHTNIKLSNLPAGAHVKIFTTTGRLLKELDADAAGQVLSWNGTDRDGRALASGVYLAVVEGTGGRRTIKFAVQR